MLDINLLLRNGNNPQSRRITKMRLFQKAIIALAFIAPAIANASTDGTLGATSTGSFIASLQVNSPAGTQVQVFGLDDFIFPAVTGQITLNTAVPAMASTFCLTRNTPGDVLVTISQTGNSGSYNLNDGAGNNLNLGITVERPAGAGATGTSNNSSFATAPSGVGCTAASTNSVAHTMRLSPGTILAQNNPAVRYGAFSGSFTITVSPQ
jgi:hypothetical protein